MKTKEVSLPRIGIIGCGNLGTAIVRGLSSSFANQTEKKVFVYDHNLPKIERLHQESKFNISPGVEELINESEVLLIAVKPHSLEELLKDIKAVYHKKLGSGDKKLPSIITVAAGKRIDFYQQLLGKEISEKISLVRAMPNIGAMINCSLTGIYCKQESLDQDLVNAARIIFSAVGEIIILTKESDFDVVTALAAGGPAFCLLVLEGLSDGGLKMGLKKHDALKMASFAMKAAADLVLKTGLHPTILKDQISSPAGTTVEGLAVLEKNALRSVLSEAIEASTKRATEIGV